MIYVVQMVENERLGAVAESTGDLKQSINFYETAAEYAKTLYYYTEVRYPPPTLTFHILEFPVILRCYMLLKL